MIRRSVVLAPKIYWYFISFLLFQLSIDVMIKVMFSYMALTQQIAQNTLQLTVKVARNI